MCKCKNKCGCNISTTTQGQKGDPSIIPTLGYKVYTALLTQSGTAAPTALVLMNTLGEVPVFSYSATGTYIITSPGGLFPTSKTFVFFGPLEIKTTVKSGAVMFDSGAWTGSIIKFFTYKTDTSALADNFMINTPIEIRVYN